MLGLGWVVLLFWSIHGSGSDWRTWLWCAGGWLAWLLIAWKTWSAYRNQPTGKLCWDGSCWWWQPSNRTEPHLMQVKQILLDLQWGIALMCQAPGAERQSFWLQQDGAISSWDDIRRAVYSSAIAAKSDTPLNTSP